MFVGSISLGAGHCSTPGVAMHPTQWVRHKDGQRVNRTADFYVMAILQCGTLRPRFLNTFVDCR
jgi:hypothetical protein